MAFRVFLWVLCLCVWLAASAPSQVAGPQPVLAGLRKEHPRVMLTADSLRQLRRRVVEDEDCAQIFLKLTAKADQILAEDVVTYDIPDGVRLLSVARRVLDRVQVLGCVFLVTDREKYRERMWQELEAAAQFPDWNTKHFLDTATLCRAFGLAYDWLFEQWSEQRRRVLRRAMVEKALKPAMSVMDENRWWARGYNNWTQVCAGGVVLGALAIAEEEPDLARRVVEGGVKALRKGVGHFAPDGGWFEAPGYWHYATRYFVAALIGMETALGHDFGLSKSEGFLKTWRFPLYMCGPDERVFNYGDCGLSRINSWELFYFAERNGVDAPAEWQVRKATDNPSPLDLLFWSPPKESGSWSRQPLDARFEALDVVSMRSAWGDPRATFVGIKGGRNGRSHGQLDLGTFVFATGGERWALELGAENYNLPGYWNMGEKGTRWKYYRCRAEGGNNLVINPGNGPDQNVRARAPVVRAELQVKSPRVVLDLSAACSHSSGKLLRGFQLVDREGLLIVDEIELEKPSEVYWFVHTRAKVRLIDDGRIAVLRKGRKRCEFRILQPSTAQWSVGPAVPLPSSPKPKGSNPNNGYLRLAIHLTGVKSERIAVWMAESRRTVPIEKARVSLAKW